MYGGGNYTIVCPFSLYLLFFRKDDFHEKNICGYAGIFIDNTMCDTEIFDAGTGENNGFIGKRFGYR